MPQMVAGHVVEDDGKAWKLALRDGLVFHDGQPVFARDCVASIRRWSVRDSFGQTLMQRTDELSAPDDHTILFRLKRPFPRLPQALSKLGGSTCVIMPERLAATDPFKQVTEMVGSGPYRFKADERVPGSLVVYERFEGYKPREGDTPDWTSGPKVAHFDRVEWRTIPDPATAAAALRAGEVDWWEFPPSDLYSALARSGQVRLKLLGSASFCALLRPNHLFPPFDNPAVRRALMGAIDQTAFMTAAVGTDPTLRHVPCGFFPPVSPMASDAGMGALTGPRDYDKVGKDLRAAGYKGEKVVLMAPTDIFTLKGISDVAADTMRRVGMDVDYQATDWGTVVQRRVSRNSPVQGGWNAVCTSLSGTDMLNPAQHLALRGNGAQASYGWPSSPRIEELRERWLEAPDLAAQKQLATEIQAKAFEDVPYYPLGVYYLLTAYRANLDGIQGGIPAFWGVRRA
jgi:peptide/nickel transport system substrate-binding protein